MQASRNAPEVERLDDCLSIRGDALYVEEYAAEALAERFGTPLYVISEDQLRRNARRYRDAFEGRWPGEFLLLPSIKANPALALRPSSPTKAPAATCSARASSRRRFGPGPIRHGYLSTGR